MYATIKAFTSVSGTSLSHVPHTASPASLLVVIGAMVGLSTWGNEPDIFRYAKAGRKSWWNIPTLAISYFLGAFIFPIMGYMIAAVSDQSDFAASIKYFANFTLFGLSGLMMVVLLVNQWAVQDGNLYIAINGAQNLLSRIPRWRRQYTVVGLGLAAACYLHPAEPDPDVHVVTGIGAVTVPVASTIMAMDVFVVPRLFGLRRPLHRVASWAELAAANWPAIVALVAGTAVGAFTAGLVPALRGSGIPTSGFPALQAWVTGAVVYLIGVALVARSARPRRCSATPASRERPGRRRDRSRGPEWPTGYDLVIRAARAIVGGGREPVQHRRNGRSDSRGGSLRVPLPRRRQPSTSAPTSSLLPGLVDSHVHVCEPGNTDWEGFATATRAAAAGGITTPGRHAAGQRPDHRRPWRPSRPSGRPRTGSARWTSASGAASSPATSAGSRPLHAGRACSGFKCFLADSGSPDFPPLDAGEMAAALRVAARLGRAAAGARGKRRRPRRPSPEATGRKYADYLASRPRGLENLAIAQVIEAARVTGGHAHVVHLSSSDALPMIASAQHEGVRVSAETCPHYLTLAAEEIADGATAAKCSPPVREAANRELLWAGPAGRHRGPGGLRPLAVHGRR